MKYYNFCLPLILLILCWSFSSGLSPAREREKESQEIEVYKIVGLSGGPQRLPASHVKTFSRWKIEELGEIIPASEEECAIGKGNVSEISLQPTINFLLKSGVPSYVFVGLQVQEVKEKQNNLFAQLWTNFDISSEPMFRIEIFLGQQDGVNVQRLGVVDAKRIRQALEQLGKSLASTGNEELASGFHIIEMPLKMDTEALNNPRGKGGAMMITCVATTEPDAARLLRVDEAELEKIAISKLQVDAWRVLSTA